MRKNRKIVGIFARSGDKSIQKNQQKYDHFLWIKMIFVNLDAFGRKSFLSWILEDTCIGPNTKLVSIIDTHNCYWGLENVFNTSGLDRKIKIAVVNCLFDPSSSSTFERIGISVCAILYDRHCYQFHPKSGPFHYWKSPNLSKPTDSA